MKMLIGPYADRFFGNLPIAYQKYLLDNIKRINKDSHSGGLVEWLTQHTVRISKQAKTPNIGEQIKILENLCGQEFQPKCTTDVSTRTKDSTDSVRGTSYVPKNPFK